MRRPSGDQAGSDAHIEPRIGSFRKRDPSGRTTAIPQGRLFKVGKCLSDTAIQFPSGDQAGSVTSRRGGVIRRTPLPSASTTKAMAYC
jgi:hypothetical protein